MPRVTGLQKIPATIDECRLLARSLVTQFQSFKDRSAVYGPDVPTQMMDDLVSIFGSITELHNHEISEYKAAIAVAEANLRTATTYLKAANAKIAAFESEDQKIPEKAPVPTLPWHPHDGTPRWTQEQVMAWWGDRRARSAIARSEMNEEQRANYVGDAKPAT